MSPRPARRESLPNEAVVPRHDGVELVPLEHLERDARFRDARDDGVEVGVFRRAVHPQRSWHRSGTSCAQQDGAGEHRPLPSRRCHQRERVAIEYRWDDQEEGDLLRCEAPQGGDAGEGEGGRQAARVGARDGSRPIHGPAGIDDQEPTCWRYCWHATHDARGGRLVSGSAGQSPQTGSDQATFRRGKRDDLTGT
jgi:hypothetical protein